MEFRDFVCGYIVGFAQTISGQPLDVIKVKIQASTQHYKISKICRQIYNNHGIKGYWIGSSSLFVSYGMIIAMQFLVYQWAKRTILQFKGIRYDQPGSSYSDFTSKLSVFDITLAGQAVGLATGLIFCPIEYVKIQRQLKPHLHSSSIALLWNQIRSHGFKNITKGMGVTVGRQLSGSLAFFPVYQESVRILSKNERNTSKSFDYALGGALAGAIYVIVSYPFDIIKTKVQNNMSYKKAFEQFKMQKLRGISPSIAKSMVISSVGFFVYEECRKLLDKFDQYKSKSSLVM